MQNKIVIVIPYLNKDKDLIDKLIPLLKCRAGVPVDVHCVEDSKTIGWHIIHNLKAKELDYDWYVYGCSDYFPCRQFIKLALDVANKTGKKLIGFNDGKWFGKNATVGMIHKSLIPKVYGGPLFYPSYYHHGADPDLTEKVMSMGEYAYAPEAVYMEIDYDKDLHNKVNPEDMALFRRRKERGFPNY